METLVFPDAAGWESWLEANHESQTEAWLVIAKRHPGIDSIAIEDALDVAHPIGMP